MEFIKYAFDNSQEKHPLRYYVPYGVDENNDERILYTRLLKYCQKYRDQEYEEFKQKGLIRISTTSRRSRIAKCVKYR